MHSISYLIRAKEIQDFAAQFYEPGRHDKCYKQVWLKHVFPKYGFNYDTFPALHARGHQLSRRTSGRTGIKPTDSGWWRSRISISFRESCIFSPSIPGTTTRPLPVGNFRQTRKRERRSGGHDRRIDPIFTGTPASLPNTYPSGGRPATNSKISISVTGTGAENWRIKSSADNPHRRISHPSTGDLDRNLKLCILFVKCTELWKLPKENRVSEKIVRTAGIVVVAVLLLRLRAQTLDRPDRPAKDRKEVAEQTGGMCRISIDRVRFNPVGRSMRLKGIVLTTDSLLLAKRHPGLRMFRLTAASFRSAESA